MIHIKYNILFIWWKVAHSSEWFYKLNITSFSCLDSITLLIAEGVEWDLTTNKTWRLKSWVWPKKPQMLSYYITFLFFLYSLLFLNNICLNMQKCFFSPIFPSGNVCWSFLQLHIQSPCDKLTEPQIRNKRQVMFLQIMWQNSHHLLMISNYCFPRIYCISVSKRRWDQTCEERMCTS